MILHAASIAAFFVNQLAQTPVVVQCMQSTGQDPFWARLIFAAIPSIFALGIAWLAIRWNLHSDHRRWVRDNKKAEWKELLMYASAIEIFMPSVAIGSELIGAVHDSEFNKHLRDMTRAALNCLFISETKSQKIYQMLVSVRMTNEKSKGQIEDYNSNPSLAYQLKTPQPLQSAKQVQFELAILFRDVRRLASEDLELELHEPWWRFLFNRLKKSHRPKVEGKAPQDDPPDAA
jgi:hypothetical protein